MVEATGRVCQARTHWDSGRIPGHGVARSDGVGVFRLHPVSGFAEDRIPLKMTVLSGQSSFKLSHYRGLWSGSRFHQIGQNASSHAPAGSPDKFALESAHHTERRSTADASIDHWRLTKGRVRDRLGQENAPSQK